MVLAKASSNHDHRKQRKHEAILRSLRFEQTQVGWVDQIISINTE